MASNKKNMFQLMGLSLIAYPFGFINQMLMSYYFGTSASVDAYWIAITIVNFMLFWVHPAKDALVPAFFKYYRKNQESGFAYFSQVGNFLLIIACCCLILLFFFPELITNLVVHSSQTNLKSKVFQIMPYVLSLILLISITEILNGILISFNKVIFQNFGRIIGAICSILFLLLLARKLEIFAVIIAANVSLFVLLIIQIRELYKCKLHYNIIQKPKLDPQFLRMSGALFLTYLASQIYILMERNTFSYFGEGVISAFQYGNTISQVPQYIFVVSLSTTLWPRFMELKERDEYEHIFSLLNVSCRRLIILISFITIFSWLFSEELIYLLYYRGSFNTNSLELTNLCFKAQILAACSIGVSMVIGRIYISFQQSRSVILVGLTTTVLGCITLFIAKRFEHLELSLFHVVIANTGGLIVNIFMLATLYSRLIKKRFPLFQYFFWLSKLSLLCFCIVWFYPKTEFQFINKFQLIVDLMTHAFFMIIIFFSFSFLLRIINASDLNVIFQPIKAQLKRWK
jgi:putative peptidoglycan lipid II flippase